MKKYRIQTVYLMLAAFFGLLAYPFTRTSAAPYFNEAFGAGRLPWAMIAAAILAVIVVGIYNRLAKNFQLIPLCIAAMLCIIAVTTIFGFLMGSHPPWLALLYYAWSDVYILILVEQFWSISNTLFDKEAAKKYYGPFLFFGSFGSLVGNALVTKLATPLGANNLIFFCSFFLLIFTAFILLLNNSIGKITAFKKKFLIEQDIANRSTLGGASLVFKSRYLLLIALLIVATQLYINGSYFILNQFLDSVSKEITVQSALYGKTFLFVQAVTILCNIVLTPLALKYLGVGKTHYSIVFTILAVFIITVISPHLALVAILFVLAKGFDYSIFRAAKEMFYLPLHVAEKFQAKSFIDIFGYRFTKAIAAFSLILVTGILGLSAFYIVGLGILMWFVLIILIMKIYNRMKS